MNRWFKTNALIVNAGKTQIMKFGSIFLKDYFAFFTSVQTTHVCKYLGILIDNKPTVKFYIEYVCKQYTKFCGIVWKVRYFFSKEQMLRFYKAYIIPTIIYGILNTAKHSKLTLPR